MELQSEGAERAIREAARMVTVHEADASEVRDYTTYVEEALYDAFCEAVGNADIMDVGEFMRESRDADVERMGSER